MIIAESSFAFFSDDPSSRFYKTSMIGVILNSLEGWNNCYALLSSGGFIVTGVLSVNYPSSLTTLSSVSARMPPSAIGLRLLTIFAVAWLLRLRMMLGDENDLLGFYWSCLYACAF